MTTPVPPSKLRRRRKGEDGISDASLKARLFLLVACIWPLIIFALFESSSPQVNSANTKEAAAKGILKAGAQKLGNVLDRVDILGYGPTHPRVAVVVVGDDKDRLVTSVESIFRNTDLNRMFLVCAVLDGHAKDDSLVESMEKIDSGAVPHWHGLRPDLHLPGQTEPDEDDPHGRKVHVMFNEEKKGMAASRADAVTFINILSRHHEEAGLKSPQEDLILVFLQCGARLDSRKWLGPVTSALIVPPPLIAIEEDTSVALKLSNAVSFSAEGPGKRTSFDNTFAPLISEPSVTDINLSSGTSYPTPALFGAATAMRLDTYLNLPGQDLLEDSWLADLDLSLNLWLCADGIDILSDVTVLSDDRTPHNPLPPKMAARFAGAWMDQTYSDKIYASYTQDQRYETLTHLEWETYIAEARHSPTFPRDMSKRCRPFKWYLENINTDLLEILEKVDKAEANRKPVVPKIAPEETVKKIDDAIQKIQEAAPQKAEAEVKEELPQKAEAEVKEEPPKQDQQVDEAKPVEDEHHEPPEIKENKQPDDEMAIPERRELKKPSKPLCPECLEIVQKAKPIDISYVDVSGGHKEHPHMGAKDENGNWGYVHNETELHDNPPKLTYPEQELREGCLKRDNNWRMLTEKVSVDFEGDKQANESGKKRDKIFCLVYTTESGHEKIPLIRETWGPKCDGFMVGSTKTDRSIGAVEIPHQGEEAYDNIWQKVRSMWSYIYDNYYEKYDWFHIGGDDLYLLVENFRLYLESEEIRTAANGGIYLPTGDETTQVPLFLGRRFAYMGDMNDIFNSGGSGYTMNKAAFKALVVDGLPNYFPNAHTFSEDTMTARVFRKMGIFPYETKDETGAERYMPFMPGHHYGYKKPPPDSKDWYAKYSINIKYGPDHCAKHSVAFHYVKGPSMKRLHALLYHLCPADTLG